MPQSSFPKTSRLKQRRAWGHSAVEQYALDNKEDAIEPGVAGQYWHGDKTWQNVTATQVTFTPVGGIAATDVQAAIAELDSEKANSSSLGTAASKNTGTSGNTVPLLDGSNTWSALQIFSNLRISATTPEFTMLDSDTSGSNALGYMTIRDSANVVRGRLGKPFAGGSMYIDNTDDGFWFSKNGSGLIQFDTASSRVNLPSGYVVRINSVQVLSSRKTGWAAATGTATRTTYDTTTVTTAQLAERVKALIDDLISHGLIGA